jgi:hypothetical protein
MNHRCILFPLLIMFCSFSTLAAEGYSRAERWTQFAQSLETLHEQRMKSLRYTTQESIGGYGGIRSDPEYYREVKYLEPGTGKLLAVVQRENNPKKLLHVIELYIYDDKGQVLREYLATYLPGRRETPYQTLITLYAYEGGLKAFRQFDASNDLLFEHCAGDFEGKKVRISFDEFDVPNDVAEISDEFERKAYQSCFQSLPRTAGPYLNPLTELE